MWYWPWTNIERNALSLANMMKYCRKIKGIERTCGWGLGETREVTGKF